MFDFIIHIINEPMFIECDGMRHLVLVWWNNARRIGS
jgi:hypothetical protein